MTRRLVRRSTSALDMLAELRHLDFERDVARLVERRAAVRRARRSIRGLLAGYLTSTPPRHEPGRHIAIGHATCGAPGGADG
jgi:hypothetical protein